MSDELQRTFEAVRDACPADIWSRGVELARTASVARERADEDEVVLRVTTRAGMASPRVSLFLDDAEWECECAARTPSCEHVAAAVIALRRGDAGEDVLAAPGATTRIGYRLTRARAGLGIERVLLRGEEVTPFEDTITRLRSRDPALRLSATQPDLAVELALGARHRGLIPPAKVERVFLPLSRCSDVTLDGRPVLVSSEPLLPLAVVEDHGEGFRVRLEEDPGLVEVFGNGIALVDNTLRAAGEIRLPAVDRDRYRTGRYFASDQLAELVSEALPALKRVLPVDVRTARLPDTERVPPRISIETRHEGRALAVTAWIVYGDPPCARVEGERLVHLRGSAPLRDPAAERRLADRLRGRLGLVPGIVDRVEGTHAVELVERLEAFDGELAGDGHHAFRRMPPLSVRFETRGLDFDVEFRSASGDAKGGSADPHDVVRAWRAGESMVPLLEGGWAPLPADWLERYGRRLADLLAARAAAETLPEASLPDLLALCDELEVAPAAPLTAIRERIDTFETLAPPELPGDLQATLRPYQRDGVAWLQFLRASGWGGLLADDMGLGKTLQALCAVHGRTLVVCPTSVLHNWADEIARFRPALSVNTFHGPARALEEADVTLTTYGLLRQDRDRLADIDWDTVVLDEAQAVKNPDSRVAQAAFSLSAPFRVTLTGTPVENRLDELWSQLHFANRGLLGDRGDFKERYADPIDAGDDATAEYLRRRIRPFVLRRLKRDVAPELPPRTDVVLHCELAPDEREVYDTIRAATLRKVVDELDRGGSVLAALEALLRLRQAACHPGLVPGQDAEASSKVGLLIETLETVVAEGHKALVFSQWTGLLDRVEPPLGEAGIAFTRLDGSTRDRASVVKTFQGDDGPPVMLISLKAGGTGLNLTAADHVFILDPWWNPAVEDQAADRAHRIGQDKPVLVHRLVAEQTVEERILALQQRKRELAATALDGAEGAGRLTRQDLLALLD